MSGKKHLSSFGIGPVYVGIIAIITIAAFLCRDFPLFSAGNVTGVIKSVLNIIGVIFIILGIYMWMQAVVISKVGKSIKENELVTTGIYSAVRNPIYSAFMIICTGIILITGNWLFFILPFFYWILMTVLVKNTEEKWLSDLYGKEYREYCKRVNRCIPYRKK